MKKNPTRYHVDKRGAFQFNCSAFGSYSVLTPWAVITRHRLLFLITHKPCDMGMDSGDSKLKNFWSAG
jgi:hypothetical protein